MPNPKDRENGPGKSVSVRTSTLTVRMWATPALGTHDRSADWFASRHFQSYDLFVRKTIEVLDECSQRITVGDDQNCVGSCERRDARVVFTIASFGPSSGIGLSTNSTLPSPCITNAFMVYVIVDRLLRFISVSEMQSLCRWRKQGASTDLLQTLRGNTQQVLTITQSSPR